MMRNVFRNGALAASLLLAVPIVADEVLPSLSAEKMSEYKNAFGKAISESRGAGVGTGMTGSAGGGHKGPGGGAPPGLGGLSRQARESVESKGSGALGGPGHGGGLDKGPHGEMKAFPGGGDGMRPPPGFGGPGQPGGPR